MATSFKPTLREPTEQGEKFEKNFDRTMKNYGANLNEVDNMLNEKEQSLKKKIFSLDKMESLVFSDPKLSSVYDSMSENGAEKYGYHYNETIMNMLFNDYVLNSSKYLQKYKMAIPKEKKRRDKSGINQLKNAGENTMAKQPKFKVKPTEPTVVDEPTNESSSAGSAGGAAGYVGYAGPSAWSDKGDLLGDKGKPMRKPIWKGGTVIQESNYLTETDGFEKFIQILNEESDADFISRNGSNTYGNVDNMSPENQNIIKNDIQTGTLDEKSKSKSQQRFMGMVHAVQKGELSPNEVGGSVEKAANSMSDKDAKDFASTKHKGLPNKVDEYLMASALIGDDIVDIQPRAGETPFLLQNGKYQYETATYKNGRKDLVVYSFNDDVYYDYTKFRKEMGIDENNNAELPQRNNKPAFSNKNIKEVTKTNEEMQSIVNGTPDSISNKMETSNQSTNMETGTQSSSMSEANELLEEINNELNAFSIHHDKLKRMAEDRKPSTLVMKDRLGADNEKNFKKDLQHSGTKEIIDVEKELEYQDQQTEVGDPQKLAADIEKNQEKNTKGTALKNVGNSANDEGDEIPKRNLKTEEQEEVDNYRLGLNDLVYDNEPGDRFEERTKAEMGDKLYQQRQDKLAFRAKAPMYNKDAQPMEKTKAVKAEFDKEKSGWNEREGLKESVVSGKYIDILGKKRIIDFNLSEAIELNTPTGTDRQTGLFEINLEGMGNTYTNKVDINESAVKAMDRYKFYTDEDKIYVLKNEVKNINEAEEKNIANTEFDKMKHLSGYKPNTFTSTNNVKKNRGF